MRAYCLASSSAGNSYVLVFGQGTEAQTLLLECGLPLKDIRVRMLQNNLRLSDVKACLVTHSHDDHAHAVNEILSNGITTYSSQETFEALGVEDNRFAVALGENKPTVILPDIIVVPFQVVHDAPKTFGYVIENRATDERVLFITDAKLVQTDLSAIKFDYVFIECNHTSQQVYTVLNKAIQENDYGNVKRYKRLVDSHMSLSGCIKHLAKLDLRKCKAIFLVHLSDGYANEYFMKGDIKRAIGIDAFVCGKNGGIK